MAEGYELTKVRQAGDAGIWQVTIPDGTTERFIYTNAQKSVEAAGEHFDDWVAWAVRRAHRASEYVKARARG